MPDAPTWAGSSGWPAARDVVCVSNRGEPFDAGHNRVCVCRCQWCKAERDRLPAQADLFAALDNRAAP
jgi:hypothetical protein